jgi:hypothetical protein
MKKHPRSKLKTAFQAVAVAVAQVTGEDQASAMNSAGIFADNVSSGLTLNKLRNFKDAVLSYLPKRRGS